MAKKAKKTELKFSEQLKTIRRVFGPYFSGIGWKIWGPVLLLFGLSFYGQFWTIVRGYLLDFVTGGKGPFATVAAIVIGVMVLTMAKEITEISTEVKLSKEMKWSIELFKNRTTDKILKALPEIFQKFSYADIWERLKSVSEINNFVGEVPRVICRIIRGIIAIAFICIVASPWFVLLFVIEAVFIYYRFSWYTPREIVYDNRHKDWSNTKHQALKDTIERYKEIHLNGSYKETVDFNLRNALWSWKASNVESIAEAKFWFLTGIVLVLLKYSFYLFTFYLLSEGAITAGNVYEIFTFRKDAEDLVWALKYVFTKVVPKYANTATRVEQLTGLGEQYYGSENKNPDFVGLSLRNVYSSYKDPNDKDKRVEVLKGVNLEFRTGHVYAIVGRSGCGKSTTSEIICRLQEPDQGEIILIRKDGTEVPIKEISRDQIPSHVGMVLQTTQPLCGSFADQFKWIKGYKKAKMIQCCKKAQLHDFIMSLEDGYDTQIGDRGLKLSGGQRQRLAIALALMQNPWILILDEATSAQDARTQKEIFQSLTENGVFDGKIVILIAHRLSTVTNADKIFVLGEGGTILEEGTSTELFRRGGYYHDMVEDEVGALKDLFIEEYKKMR